jgi:biopolymer transport protein ExbB
MINWLQPLEAIRIFVDTGGAVVMAIAVTALLLWLLLVERALYLWFGHAAFARELAVTWRARSDRASVMACHIRDQMLAEARRRLGAGLSIMGGLIALCPVLGLLGTVSGMIGVFDIVAAESSGDARAMADGIARATLPTLAGMVVAVSGLGFRALLTARDRAALRRLEKTLVMGGGRHATA